MTLIAVRIVFKHNTKEVLRASIFNVETEEIIEMGSDMLIDSLMYGKISILNLKVEHVDFNRKNAEVKICNYSKNIRAFNKIRRNDVFINSYVYVTRGYKGLYEFIVDNPLGNKPFKLIGTVNDLRCKLKTLGFSWNGELFNGRLSDRSYAMKTSRQLIDIDNGNKPENSELHTLLEIRESISCSSCELRLIDNIRGFVIINPDFNKETVEIPYIIGAIAGRVQGVNNLKLFGNTVIESGAFCKSKDIKSIDIRGDMVSDALIKNNIFESSSIQDIRTSENIHLTGIGTRAFADCKCLKGRYVLSVSNIDLMAFSGAKLEGITLIDNRVVGVGAFSKCLELKSFKGEDTLSIEESAFLNCSKLSKVVLKKVRKIGDNAFKNCRSLKEIKLPRDVIIGREAIPEYTKIVWM